MNIKKYHSELDSIRFNYNVAKINFFEYDVRRIVEELRRCEYRLIISRVDANNIDLINQLENNGFLLKDIQMKYKYELSESINLPINREIKIRKAVLNDKNKICEIASDSFENYGHYAADKNIDIKISKEIYTDWVNRTFDKNYADVIIIAEYDSQIAGFLSHKIYTNDDNKKYAAGVIGAVDKKYRNLNVFRAITLSGINWCIDNNCNWVEHNVLITNSAVARSFIKLGFKPSNPEITFHKWI